MKIQCVAFDCFGTVFDMSGISRSEISDYVEHVNREDFSPFEFPRSWWNLKAHPDAAKGIKRLQNHGILCIALSNGSHELLHAISTRNAINWNFIVDLAKYRVYKPKIDAYRTVEKETGLSPSECLMVTANPSFGDLEGADAIGMKSEVIRAAGYPLRNVIELAEFLGC